MSIEADVSALQQKNSDVHFEAVQTVSFYVCVISELCILSQHAHVIVHFYMSTLAKESAASRGQIYSIY